MVYALAVLAALLVGVGSVIEQRTAAQAPPELSLSPRLLVWLAKRPIWLSGFSCTLLGNLVFARHWAAATSPWCKPCSRCGCCSP